MSIGKAFVPTITPGACIVCNQSPYHLPFKCPEMRNVQFMQERCRAITLDPTISDSKKQEYVSTIKALISRETPRSNPPPPPPTTSSAVASPRRQGPWTGTGNSVPAAPSAPSSHGSSSRGVSGSGTGVTTSQSSSGQASIPPKTTGSGQRMSHGHSGHNQHQGYNSQVPPQYVSSRPKDSHHGSISTSGLTAGRSDGQRQREYDSSNYPPPRAVPQHHTSPSHMTSGARESSNYQSRKSSYRSEDGSAAVPPGRSAG
ncbi:hypothetical protein BGZ65_012180, partial [Modicella reniformis]